jgi:hypothetical protein
MLVLTITAGIAVLQISRKTLASNEHLIYLAQMQGRGHGLMYQYPEKRSSVDLPRNNMTTRRRKNKHKVESVHNFSLF